jgi:voltage-gated potassium channel
VGYGDIVPTTPAAKIFSVFGTLLRMLWALQHLITRGGLTYLLMVAVLVLLGCGLGFWWLEPTTPTLADGMWLAFTTAATVGYGDIVPTTPAAKIFSVFVVLLGFGVLTLVTAAIATSWVETEERRIEREILRDMRREMASVRHELAELREELARAQGLFTPPEGSAASQRQSM